VLGVVIFHANLGLPGGFAGVDVFFVISGYLITKIILNDIGKGKFSMLEFWERRIRRIFPALAVVVLFCLVAGWFLLLPFGYLVLAQSAIALSCFASNIQFWRTISYWSPAAEENPLLHTWSLSVEEQFYLIVPLLIAGFYKFKRGFLVPIVIAFGVAVSFTTSSYLSRVDPTGAFYLLQSRAWELGMGALVSFLPSLRTSMLRELIASVGLLGILWSLFLLDSEISFPGVSALPCVLGTALLIWVGAPNAQGHVPIISRSLSLRPLVAIGLISYSLYLWHWPFFAFYRYLFGQPASQALSLLFIGLAFFLSFLSWRFVEQPFRKKEIAQTRKSLFTIFAVLLTVIVTISLVIYLKAGLPSRIPEEAIAYDRVEGNADFVSHSKRELPGGGQILAFGDSDKKPEVLVWGDSHAQVMLHVLDSACRELGLSGIAAFRGGTPPTFSWSGESNGSSEHRNSLELGEEVGNLIDNQDIKTVFLIFRWSYHVRRNPSLHISRKPIEGFEEAFIKTIETLTQKGIRVVVFEEVPIFQNHIARAMALNAWIGTPKPSLSVEAHRKFRQPYASVLDHIILKFPNVVIFDPGSCIYLDDHICYLSPDGILLYRDEHHWTKGAAFKISNRILELLKQ
jgi:peptidoglycan/LPS O-acetylase OafA/YrhL